MQRLYNKSFSDSGWTSFDSTVQSDLVFYSLGNTRVTFKDATSCSASDHQFDVVSMHDYYAFGKVLRAFTQESERYLTTQHPRDAETDWDYRGARFYDSDIGRFLGVDPLAGKFPNMSPYVFCNNNPIFYVDLDGLEPTGYTMDTDGNIEKVNDEGGTEYDVLWQKTTYDNGYKNYNLEGSDELGIRINDTSFISELQKIKIDGYQDFSPYTQYNKVGFFAQINHTQAIAVFKFLSDATSSQNPSEPGEEWALVGLNNGETFIGTVHDYAQAFDFRKSSMSSDKSKWKFHYHSHPGASADSFTTSDNDRLQAKDVRKHNPSAKFYVYMPELSLTTYNRIFNGKLTDPRYSKSQIESKIIEY